MERIKVKAGSGDVFIDLGYADAKERRVKVRLALEVNQVLEKRGLPRARVAKLLGLRQPQLSP